MLAWMIARFAIFPGFLFVMVVACGGATTPAAVPTPIPATLPAATATSTAIKRSATQVKYQLISHYGGVFYCDPDFYPVNRTGQEQERARAEFPKIRQDGMKFTEIAKELNLPETTDYSADQQLAVHKEHKKLGAVSV